MKIEKFDTDVFCLWPAVFITLDKGVYGYKSFEIRLFYGMLEFIWDYD